LIIDELDSLVRPDIVNKVTTEIIHLMMQKGLNTFAKQKKFSKKLNAVRLVKLSMPE